MKLTRSCSAAARPDRLRPGQPLVAMSLPACLRRGEQGIDRLGELGQIANTQCDPLLRRAVNVVLVRGEDPDLCESWLPL